MPDSLLTTSLRANAPRSTYFEKYHGAMSQGATASTSVLSPSSIEKRAAKASKRQNSFNEKASTSKGKGKELDLHGDFADFESSRQRRQASVRHSRAPSSSGGDLSPTLSSSVERSFASVFQDAQFRGAVVTADTMDAMVDALPRSPGARRGRSRDRIDRHTERSQDSRASRSRENEMDWHGRQLRARLQHLTQFEPSSPQSTDAARVERWRRTISSTDTSNSNSNDNSQSNSNVSTAPISALPSSGPSRSASSYDILHDNSMPAIPSINDIVNRHSSPPRGHKTTGKNTERDKTPKALPSCIPSIDELVSQHKLRLQTLPSPPPPPNPTPYAASQNASMFKFTQADNDHSRTSIDSVAAEMAQSLDASRKALEGEDDDSPRGKSSTPILLCASNPPAEDQLAQYLRSPRLTRLLTLYPSTTNRMTVSFADVGDPRGHPVFVYLGLGCARYLVALFDEIAEILKLRIVCIDRWGNGQTSQVADHRRSFDSWAEIVEQVADQLSIKSFSVLAHSAGAPYAFATAFRCPERITGSLHLLAPWINSNVDGQSTSYKWLKLVPNKVIASAQAAEWKLQAWKLGRPPTINVTPVGYDPRAPVSSAEFSDSMLDDVQGREILSLDDYSSQADSDAASTVLGRSVGSSKRKTSSKGLSSFLGRRNSENAKANVKPPVYRSASASSVLDANEHSSQDSLGIASSPSSRLRHASTGAMASESPSFANVILRASHAESFRGGKLDLLMILERRGKAWDFDYADLKVPCKIWMGENDERISVSSVRALSNAIPQCSLKLLRRTDHNLLTNVDCMMDVLSSISEEAEGCLGCWASPL